MQHIKSETQVSPSRTVAAESVRPSGSRMSTDEDFKDVSNDAGLCRSVQCFICSRIYFDPSLSKPSAADITSKPPKPAIRAIRALHRFGLWV
jgi:hypothetical protein